MLDQGSGVRIPEHTDASHERDRVDRLLAEPMSRVTADGNNTGTDHAIILAFVVLRRKPSRPSMLFVSIRRNFFAGLASQLGQPSGMRGRLVVRALNRGNRKVTAAAVEALGVAHGDRAMDVGFGGGVGIQLLLDRLNDRGHVTGVDISETTVRAAQRRFRKEIGAGRVTIIHGSADRVPVTDGSIDALLTVNTLYFVEDLAATMQELRRILSPAGRVAFGVGDKDAMTKMPFTAHGFRLRTTEEIASVAEANGLMIAGHERVGQGPGAFHVLIARPDAASSTTN